MKNKSKIVLLCGNFNVIHSGHLRILRFAKKLGGKLFVGVNSDKLASKAAFIPEKKRLEGVKSNTFVDKSFIIKKSLQKEILKIRPNIIVKGQEYENKFNIEEKILKKWGGKIIFSSGDANLSSIDLINKEFKSYTNVVIKHDKHFLQRHKISKENLIENLKNFKKKNVLVVGDSIVDEYITTQPVGMSQEDPTIVVTTLDNKKFIGGASIIASHASSLGAKSKIITIAGQDKGEKFLKKELKIKGVNAKIIVDDSRPTTIKKRYRTSGKNLFRVNIQDQRPISKIIQNKIFNEFKKTIKKVDLLILSDFNYGCLPKLLVDKILDFVKKIKKNRKIFVVADSQSSSQIGDILKFKNADLLSPTEHEARLAMRDFYSGLVELAVDLLKKTKSKNLILTLNKDGVLIQTLNRNKFSTDKITSLALDVKDVAGAGDAMLISSALSMVSGGSIWISSYLGSIASALEIKKVGNVPLKIKELVEEVNKI
tara:strand:- start:562 stop:2013 length:1452 start_codon:yes stop_codon:yes gene_type:complete